EADGLRLVIGQLEGFAERVREGLDEASWATRREVVRALIKRVEVDDEEVRIVYRVPPPPFADGPHWGRLQDRGRRDDGPTGCTTEPRSGGAPCPAGHPFYFFH